MQKFPTFLKEQQQQKKNVCDNKVLQVKGDNTSYVFTFPFVLWPKAKKSEKS